jgi:hypothetical protein
MPTVLQFRRGNTSQNDAYTGLPGEITIDTTLNTVRLHDGSTVGGNVIGQTGYLGSIGYTGSRGDIGYTGSASDVIGYTGSIGVGYTGSFGDTGYTGSIGTFGNVRVVTISSGSSITVNADITDIAKQDNTETAGTLTINSPTGTPTDGQKILLKITSTNSQTFSFNSVFVGSTDLTLPTSTSGSGKLDYLGFIYNTDSSKWQFVGKIFGF